MRLTLIISRMAIGGAERVITVMANYWATHRHDVTLITIGSHEDDDYAVPSRVTRIGLNLQVSSKNLVEAAGHNTMRLKRLRSEIRASRPDVVISFVDVTNVLTLLASIGLRVPVIVSERSTPSRHDIGLAWNGLRYLLYRRAQALVMQSQDLRAWACRFVGDRAVYVIPNPVERPLAVSNLSVAPRDTRRCVVAMGHLTRVKGYDLLLRAFAKCATKHSEWSLLILGEGEERGPLETLVGELGLKDRVSLPGCVRDPAQILQRVDLFVMSSYYEGSSNALLEAMACGLAVIATDCASSVREVICHGVNGVVVPSNNENALAAAMDRLMEDQGERERLGALAVGVTERFSVESVMGMWDTAVQQVHQRVGGNAQFRSASAS
jgi:glycosyltransferase involved in cell wall biosynthesis